MTQLSTEEFAKELATNERPFVGLDIAVNMKKGLRFVARLNRGVCELTLRFRRDIRLTSDWPFIDVPIPSNSDLTRNEFSSVFQLTEDEADVVSMCFQRARVVAVDAPCSLASIEESRASELAWHRLEISSQDGNTFLKQKNRGVLWSPRETDIKSAITSYFSADCKNKPTTQQLILLSQSLWMFVGLWVYQVLDGFGTPRIEVYPHASRIICQEIAGHEEDRDSLLNQVHRWSRAFPFDGFITHKSETNDAAIASFTAFLHHSELTEELAPNEIVVPRRPTSDRVWGSGTHRKPAATESREGVS